MDNATADKFRKRAIYAARKFGFAEYAEDFAQEVLLRFSEGKGQHQTIDQAVLDAARSRFGRPGLPGHSLKHALETAQSIFDEDGGYAVEPVARELLGDRGTFERIVGSLRRKRDQELLKAVYLEGRLHRELAIELGVTEGRISQLVKAAESELKRIILIRGEKMGIELETRECSCECGNTFKCLPGSKQKYASAYCQEQATGEAPTYTYAKRKRPRVNAGDSMTGNIEKDFAPKSIEEREEEFENEEAAETETQASTIGNGRFTMTIPDACAQFSLPRHRLNYWIAKGYIATFRASARKILVDPTDIGMMIENGPKAKAAIEEDEMAANAQAEELEAASGETEDAAEIEDAPVLRVKRSKRPQVRAKRKATRIRRAPLILTPAHWYALGAASGGLIGAGLHFLATR
jgi:hypothetical protein